MNDIHIFQTHITANQPNNISKRGALLGLLIAFTPVLIIGLIGEWLGDGTAPGAILINIGYAFSVLAATIVLKQRDSGWRKIGLGRPSSWPKTILLAIGAVVIYIVVANIA
ncbi:MAG: hypothetical protein GY805_39945, partial [Chloroflexi bacterium]|nr:hypothetical protein [Chloroflexota bacterium]